MREDFYGILSTLYGIDVAANDAALETTFELFEHLADGGTIDTAGIAKYDAIAVLSMAYNAMIKYNKEASDEL